MPQVVMSKLSPEAIKSVLARAEEIQSQGGLHADHEEIDTVVRAATEAGLSEQAVLQALRERLSIVPGDLELGQRVYAKSSDGFFYPATIEKIDAASVKVNFLGGGYANLSKLDLRPMTLMPGQKIMCPWPDWGWWNCTLVSYNSKTDEVEVTDGWSETNTFPLTSTRLSKTDGMPKADLTAKITWWAAMIGGGVIGSAITWWLTHR
jgi:hypothetical protein